MQKYIDQLLEDVKAAHKPVDRNKEPVSLQEHFKEIEKFVSMGEPEFELSFYCGLREQQFPSAELLTNKQTKIIFNAFAEMVTSWNISVLIPKNVPLKEAYALLISTLGKKVFLVEYGSVVVEFCTEDPGTCPLNKHCLCKKNNIRNKKKDDASEDVAGDKGVGIWN